jgi:hypothetical protein
VRVYTNNTFRHSKNCTISFLPYSLIFVYSCTDILEFKLLYFSAWMGLYSLYVTKGSTTTAIKALYRLVDLQDSST